MRGLGIKPEGLLADVRRPVRSVWDCWRERSGRQPRKLRKSTLLGPGLTWFVFFLLFSLDVERGPSSSACSSLAAQGSSPATPCHASRLRGRTAQTLQLVEVPHPLYQWPIKPSLKSQNADSIGRPAADRRVLQQGCFSQVKPMLHCSRYNRHSEFLESFNPQPFNHKPPWSKRCRKAGRPQVAALEPQGLNPFAPWLAPSPPFPHSSPSPFRPFAPFTPFAPFPPFAPFAPFPPFTPFAPFAPSHNVSALASTRL